MYTTSEREQIRRAILERARVDPRISGGALTGSASVGREDAWSDIDLAFGVRESESIASLLDDWTQFMRERGAIDTYDVRSGTWVYRVFLMPDTLQIDLAFAPAAEFGARASTFRLVFGEAAQPGHRTPAPPTEFIGAAWLFALHARSSLARSRLWQAEYMLGAMRNMVVSLACVSRELPERDGRGVDRLPAPLLARLEDSLTRRLDADEMGRAFETLVAIFIDETRRVDDSFAERLAPVLREMTLSWRT